MKLTDAQYGVLCTLRDCGEPEHPDCRYSDPNAWRECLKEDSAPSTDAEIG